MASKPLTGADRAVHRVFTIPPDVKRLEEHAPCFRCGVRGSCKHRPWLQDT